VAFLKVELKTHFYFDVLLYRPYHVFAVYHKLSKYWLDCKRKKAPFVAQYHPQPMQAAHIKLQKQPHAPLCPSKGDD
jgi:hypothetical protein